MKANTKTRQRTIEVNGEKITIKTRLRTRQANPVGYRVTVNAKSHDLPASASYDLFELDRDRAEGIALNYWLDEK